MSGQGKNITINDLMGLAFPAEQADAITIGLQSGLAAAGTTLATAATSTNDIVYVGSTASNNAGFQLRSGTNFGRRQIVVNAGASTLTVYPPYEPPGQTTTVGSINNGTSTTVASGVQAMFTQVGAGQYWKE